MSSRLLFYLFILLPSEILSNNQHLQLPSDQRSTWADYRLQFEQKYRSPLLNIQEIQQKWCAHQTSILHFFLNDSSINLYLISSKRIYRITIDTPDQIQNDIITLIQSIKSRPAANQSTSLFAYQQKAYQLYNALLEPVATILPTKLRIISDGVLSKLPFEALLYEALNHVELPLSDYPFLIKKYQISYMNALQLAASSPQNYNPQLINRVLAYAPIFSLNEFDVHPSNLKPLYYNKLEVEAISELFPTDIRAGQSATIDNFLREAPTYRILHLATHTQWASLDQVHNQLAFTPKQDGSTRHLLIDSLLLSQKWYTEMVVLSTCESGTVQITSNGNGSTLAAAFAQTGIRSIITTLWRIDDKATADFMVVFYEQLKQGKAKDAALRHTKLRFIKHQAAYYAHPFYWANCVVYGDTAPIKYCKKIWQSLFPLMIAISICGVIIVLKKGKYALF